MLQIKHLNHSLPSVNHDKTWLGGCNLLNYIFLWNISCRSCQMVAQIKYIFAVLLHGSFCAPG